MSEMDNNVTPTTQASVAETSTKRASSQKRIIHPTIEITNGYKQYVHCKHWRHILSDLNMTVYEGEIYTILGPRGCGKSAVLNVILGLIKLNAGFVKVFGFNPGHELSGIPGIRVGYAPKSKGLYQGFTVNEILRYYGSLLGLDEEYIAERISFLHNLLNLPIDEQCIRYYEEGIQRQISFAIALLHEPELLILDEPCAGLDPTLTRSMWEYMKKLSKQDKTILTTTQNCDEARWSDKIGIMRSGQILLEGNPRELMEIYKEQTLERLYCNAYISQPQKIKTTESIDENPHIKLERLSKVSSEGFMYTGEKPEPLIKTVPSPITSTARTEQNRTFTKSECFMRFRRFHVLLKRDFILSLRSYFWMMIFLLFPSIYLIIFCVAIGTNPTSLPLAIVNYEATDEMCSNFDDYMSCKFLWILDKNIIRQRHYATEEKALLAAEELEVLGVLLISKNCTIYFNLVYGEIILGTGNIRFSNPPFHLMLDMTSRIVANTIEKTVQSAIRTLIAESTSHTEIENPDMNTFLEMGDPIFGVSTNADIEFMAPGLAVTFTFHIIAFVVAVVIVTDRHETIASRDYLAGVKYGEQILSCMFIAGMTTLLQATLMFLIILTMFHIPNHGNMFHLLLIVIMQIGCGITFGIFIGMISDTTATVGVYVTGSLIATMILCGVQWPLQGLPQWLYIIANYLPLTKSIEAVRTVIQRGTGISNERVWLGIVVPILWGILFTIGHAIKRRII